MESQEPVTQIARPDGVPQDSAHEAREIREVIERLIERFPQEQPDRIRAVVAAARVQFQGNPIRVFVPVFVERTARQVLEQAPAG